MTQNVIYLDHQATTPCDPRVVQAMMPYLSGRYGNPASTTHQFGWDAQEAVEQARSQLARVLAARPFEIFFTSGATEANNMVLRGLADELRGRSVVSQPTEHSSVLAPLGALRKSGLDVCMLRVDRQGRVDPERLQASLTDATRLVSIMAANNEIGTLQPLAEIGAICRQRHVLLHVDAAQAAGRMDLDVHALGINYLTLSAHKLYGPKGVGALFQSSSRETPRPHPLLLGGGQEQGRRPGTLNVPGIVGFGKAAEIAWAERDQENQRITAQREQLWEGLSRSLGGLQLNGHPQERLAGNLNVTFSEVDGDALLLSLRGIALSSGSACDSADGQPSHVLAALGLGPAEIRSTIRFGLGRGTSAEELAQVIKMVTREVTRLREIRSQGFRRGRHQA